MKIINIIKNYKIKKKYINVYNGLNLEIADKGIVFIVGKSGCGKSTLLNIISGFDKCDSGEIIYKEKNILKLSKRRLDNYRKKDIGFIVQEYNLFDNLTVYENVKINVDLQNLKIDKTRIYNLLDKLNILELKDRKINELSGGQQQRVAIARAIVKSPNLLLCDEPTGNLDIENANEIFNLLTRISKEKLVIVVTHDINSAFNYADRIIFLEDGKIKDDHIINDITYEEKNEKKDLQCKSKLFNDIILSKKIIKYKKSIWFLTLLIMIMSISSMGISILFSNFDIPKSHAKAMKKNNENIILIEKNLPASNNEYLSQNEVKDIISNDDLKKIEFMMKENPIINYKIYSNNNPLNFDFNRNNTKKNLYYNTLINNLNFVKIDTIKDLKNMKLELIGTFPKNNNEIIISEYLADYIIFYGINYVKDNKTYLFKPNSYDEIINDLDSIYINNNHVIITGIVKSKQKFELMKKTSEIVNNKLLDNELNLFAENFQNLTSVYILNDFINNLILTRNNRLDNNLFLYGITNEDETSFISSNLNGIDSNIQMTNGDELIKINTLNDNEIIINEEILNILTENKYKDQLENYLNNINAEQDRALKVYEEMIEKYYEEEIYNDDVNEKETFEYDEFKIIIPQVPIIKTEEEIKKEFTDYFINENKIINKNISVSFIDNNGFGLNKNIDFVIKGFIYDDCNVYASIKNMKEYMHDNIEISSLIFNEYESKKIEEIFINFPINNSQFTSKTIFSNSIISIIHNLTNISKMASILSIISTILSLFIITLFLTSIISFNQKKIGILRSLGVSRGTIFKMIFYKAFFINIISILVSSIIIYYIYIYGNIYFTKNMFYSIEPLIFDITIIFKLFIFSLIFMVISIIFNIIKINKLNPIEIIKKS